MADADLEPAAALAAASDVRYPNEGADYRAARIALLAEEVELRRHIERVAAQRRALPKGGAVTTDYRFVDENGAEIGLGEMFGGHDTLIAYFWMYGPQRARPCPMCTTFLGGFAAAAADLRQRVAVAVIGRSPIERQIAFKRERGWDGLPFFQAIGDDYPNDYHGLGPDGSEWPALSVFERDGEAIRHFWGAELGPTADPGQDPRGAPDTVLWNMLDLTRGGRGGRGTDWYPSLSYR